MNDYITKLLRRHRRTGVLLDANILLLYFVGSFGPKEISRFKRTQQFTEEDYSTLIKFLGSFKKVVTTPNILTEVNNFMKRDYFEKFAQGITLFDERYLPSADISTDREFKRFGLTDAGIVNLARSHCLILTDDFELSNYLAKEGVDVLNFNHIRVMSWK